MEEQRDKKLDIDPFVQYVFNRKASDKGFRARLRAAVSPQKEPAAWEYLVAYTNLNFEDTRKIYVLIGSSIALDSATNDGVNPLGFAIAKAWDLAKQVKLSIQTTKAELVDGPASARIRRLLACRTVEEACEVLRPLLAIIRNKAPGQLSYSKLMRQLRYFSKDPEKIKAQWAQEYFGCLVDSTKGEKA